MNSWLQRLHFYSSATLVYVLTAAFAWYVLQPVRSFAVTPPPAVTWPAPIVPQVATVAGRPVRIVIPNSGIDLPVDPGYYDQATGEWTLSGYHAQFAMFSSLANNLTGQTFIYGHNNNYVFGALRHNTPSVDAPALIYTDNGHILRYAFRTANSVNPTDTQILNYDGPPTLLILTCTGSLNEWRTMYNFAFVGVDQ